MKVRIQLLLIVLILAGCSTRKYTASFRSTTGEQPDYLPAIQPIEPDQLLTSTANTPVEMVHAEPGLRKTDGQVNRAERKELRIELKQDRKKVVERTNGIKSTAATQAWDEDLKLAAIFGAVGLVAFIIGTTLFWIIGSVAMIIGVVFLVKWIIRQ